MDDNENFSEGVPSKVSYVFKVHHTKKGIGNINKE
ncbi:unnamed protein product [Rhodiola kirilowii]